MKNKSSLFILVVSLLLIVSLSGVANAAQPAVNSRAGDIKSTQPAANVAAKPLQQPLMSQSGSVPPLCTILENTINEAYTLAYTDLRTAASMYQPSPNIYFLGVDAAATGICGFCTSRKTVHNCCSQQQNYTVQEQQAAGCANSDTIQQCIDKLALQCIKTGMKDNNVKSMLKQSQVKADEIATKARQLSDKINQLLPMLP